MMEYAPPNMSGIFLDKVKALSSVPDALRYKENEVRDRDGRTIISV
jgi:hypothetical protein